VTREERNVLLFVVAGVVVGSLPWPRAADERGVSAARAPVSGASADSTVAPVAAAVESLAVVAVVDPVGGPSARDTPAPVDLFPIDLNRAAAGLIEELPGIGPARARAIIELRERMGSFQSVDDLVEVRGIGPKTVERLRGLVTVGMDQGGRGRERSQRAEREVGNAAPGERSPVVGSVGTGP
jgi:competence protein ComEA